MMSVLTPRELQTEPGDSSPGRISSSSQGMFAQNREERLASRDCSAELEVKTQDSDEDRDERWESSMKRK